MVRGSIFFRPAINFIIALITVLMRTQFVLQLHHHYLIIRLLPEVASSSCKIRVLIIFLEKIFFSVRIVNIWNSLPNYVVDVQSIDVFKVHLDKFWAQQESYV